MIAPQDRIQVEAGALHLHALGPRATAEFLIALVEPAGEIPLLICMLDDYRRLTPELLRAVGGDRFPHRLSVMEVA